MKKNGNHIIVATAVVGGLLVGAPDAMAQVTYTGGQATTSTTTSSTGVTSTTVVATATAGSNTTVITSTTQVTPTTQVTVQTTQPGASVVGTVATANNTNATLAVSSSNTNSNVTITQNTSGAIVTTVPQGNSVTVGGGNTAPVVNTATTSGGTAVVTVPTGNTGAVTVTPSSSSNSVVIATSGTTAAVVNIPTSNAPVVLTSTNSTTPIVLTGNNTSASQVNVASGSVTFQNGSTFSAPVGLTVASNATLGTGGTISNTPITLVGTLRTGNAPTYTLYTGASTVVTLGTTSAGGLLADIDGTAPAASGVNGGPGKYGVFDFQNNSSIVLAGPIKPTLGGDAFNVAGDPASSGYKNPPVGTGYTIVTSGDGTGSISGAFTGIGRVGARDLTGATGTTTASMLANTTFDVVYNPKSVVLYVTPSQYQNLAQSGVSLSTNQTNAATALQNVRMVNRPLGVERLANADLKSLFDNLAPQSAGNLQTIYDQIGGGSIASLAESSVRTADLFSDTFTARARQGRAMAQTGMSSGDRTKGVAGWVQPIGQVGSVDSDGNGPGFNNSTYGAVGGIEATMNNAVLGIGFGYGRENIDSNSFGNTANADNYVFGVYGEYAAGAAFVNGTVGYTWKKYDETRNINIGSYAKTASGTADATNLNVAANVGYTFNPASFIVEPSLGLHYNSFSRDSFNETGANALSLSVAKQDYDSLQSVLGVRVAKPITLDNGMKVVPEASIGWGHELLNNKSTITANFAAGGGAFTVSGAQPGEDAALIGLGVKAQLSDRLDIYADYNGRFSGGSNQNGFALGLKYKFN